MFDRIALHRNYCSVRRAPAMMAGELDAKLWSELPEELLKLVLRRLPLSSLCRFRAVSKHWNTLPTVRPEDPYFLVISRDLFTSGLSHCSLYNLITNKWDVFDLSFLPSRIALRCAVQNPWRPRLDRSCSDGGLLCFQVVFDRHIDFGCCDFFVCNPLTRNFKRLPFFGFESQPCVDVVMHRERSGGYKIFVVTQINTGQPGLKFRHFVYDSASGAWKLILDLNRDCSDVYLSRNCSIVFEGVYYWVSGGGRQAYEVFAYDIQQDTWIAAGVKVKVDPSTLKVLFVVSSGRLLLIASSFEENSRLFRISRIDLCKMDDLVEIVVLPANFTWNRNADALVCGDSIVLASHCEFMVHVKLRSDLNEVKLVPRSERWQIDTCMATTSFDLQATV